MCVTVHVLDTHPHKIFARPSSCTGSSTIALSFCMCKTCWMCFVGGVTQCSLLLAGKRIEKLDVALTLYWHCPKLYHSYSKSILLYDWWCWLIDDSSLIKSQPVVIINSSQIFSSESRAKLFVRHTWCVRWAECDRAVGASGKPPVENMHAHVTPWSSKQWVTLEWIPRDGQNNLRTIQIKTKESFSVWFILLLCGLLAASAWQFSCMLVLAHLWQCESKGCQKETDRQTETDREYVSVCEGERETEKKRDDVSEKDWDQSHSKLIWLLLHSGWRPANQRSGGAESCDEATKAWHTKSSWEASHGCADCEQLILISEAVQVWTGRIDR